MANAISFRVGSKEEARAIAKAASRASALAAGMGFDYPFLDADMDLTACHVNDCPLKLDDLLAADEGNFGHDVFGIRRHLNRQTGRLENGFTPRFAR